MKPRARRVTIAAGVLGAAVVAGLVVAGWGTISDHSEVWRVQLAKYTETAQALLQVTLFAWDEEKGSRETKPIAISDRGVWGKGKLYTPLFSEPRP